MLEIQGIGILVVCVTFNRLYCSYCVKFQRKKKLVLGVYFSGPDKLRDLYHIKLVLWLINSALVLFHSGLVQILNLY